MIISCWSSCQRRIDQGRVTKPSDLSFYDSETFENVPLVAATCIYNLASPGLWLVEPRRTWPLRALSRRTSRGRATLPSPLPASQRTSSVGDWRPRRPGRTGCRFGPYKVRSPWLAAVQVIRTEASAGAQGHTWVTQRHSWKGKLSVLLSFPSISAYRNE